MGPADKEHAFYEWGLRFARRWWRFEVGARGPVAADDLLDDVWMRPAFVRARRVWLLGEDGRPLWEGSTPRAQSYLRTALKNRHLDVVMRNREDPVLEDARPLSVEPADLVEAGCAAHCLARLLDEQPERAWIFYVTHVSHARQPAELARETGLAVNSLHTTAARFRARLAECVRRCEEAERFRGPHED